MTYQTFPDPAPAPKEGETFTIAVPQGTDIYRSAPSHDDFNAPLIYRAFPQKSFTSAQVTVSAPWTTQYDQGGLCVVFDNKQRWIKAGIEWYHGAPFFSVVTCDRYADWSLSPLPAGTQKVTLAMEKSKNTLVVSRVEADGTRTPMREVTWAFWDPETEGQKEMWAGAFAAKPTKSAEDLVVTFEGLKIVTA